MIRAIQQTYLRNQSAPNQSTIPLDKLPWSSDQSFSTTFAPAVEIISTLDSEQTLDSHKEPEIDTSKLIILTIIILFTVVGNFGVVLAILLRR